MRNAMNQRFSRKYSPSSAPSRVVIKSLCNLIFHSFSRATVLRYCLYAYLRFFWRWVILASVSIFVFVDITFTGFISECNKASRATPINFPEYRGRVEYSSMCLNRVLSRERIKAMEFEKLYAMPDYKFHIINSRSLPRLREIFLFAPGILLLELS